MDEDDVTLIEDIVAESDYLTRISTQLLRLARLDAKAEHLPHLSEGFYRVDKARSRENGGTGLGLSLARSILAALNTHLGLTSTAGQGTTTSFILPLVRPAPA